jgi:hypothetical protein
VGDFEIAAMSYGEVFDQLLLYFVSKLQINGSHVKLDVSARAVPPARSRISNNYLQ